MQTPVEAELVADASKQAVLVVIVSFVVSKFSCCAASTQLEVVMYVSLFPLCIPQVN